MCLYEKVDNLKLEYINTKMDNIRLGIRCNKLYVGQTRQHLDSLNTERLQ